MTEYYLNNQIYYRQNIFQPGKETLVFVHGLSGSSSAWLKYEKKFQKNYNLLFFDLRGHGKSKKPKNYEDYTIEKFSEDLFDLVQHLKINNFILISHSFGTLIALEFLSHYQEMVKANIFLSPNYQIGKRPAAKLLKPFLKLTKIFQPLPFSGQAKGHLDYTKYLNTGDWNVRRLLADATNTSWRVYLYCTRQSYKFNKEHLLPKITIPCLIMHGKKDTIFPAKNSLEMAKKIKNVRLVILPAADHILVLNYFEAVSQEIEKFINSLS
jgi:pimeloyl-ACP methyl ester carboxylesterase